MKIVTFIFYILVVASSCNQREENKNITIKGNIRNLPDGTMFLMDVIEKMDSTITTNGKFSFNVPKRSNFEPRYVGFTHISTKDSIRRVFQFDTKAKFKSRPMSVDRIMLEENFPELSGDIQDSKMGDKFMSSRILGNVNVGTQSRVMYNDTLPFITSYSTQHLDRMLREYPYSYHVLYRLEKIVPTLSNDQALAFLERFDAKLRNGKTGKRIEKYIKERHTVKLSETALQDIDGKLRTILLPDRRIHLIVLWASWCGPCRQEIPELKKLYQKFQNEKSFDMVSVSLDEKKENWKKALTYEKMPWRQFIIDSKVNLFSKELFDFDGSIPTTLLIDANGKIIKKYLGNQKAMFDELESLIADYL